MSNRITVMIVLLGYMGISFGMDKQQITQKGSLEKFFTNARVRKCFAPTSTNQDEFVDSKLHSACLPLINQEDWHNYAGYVQLYDDTRSWLTYHSDELKQSAENSVIKSFLLMCQNPPRAIIYSMNGELVLELEKFNAKDFTLVLEKIQEEEYAGKETVIKTPGTIHMVVKLTDTEQKKEQYQVYDIRSVAIMVSDQQKEEVIEGVDQGYSYEACCVDDENDTIYVWKLNERLPIDFKSREQILNCFTKKSQFILSVTKNGQTINMLITAGKSGSYFHELLPTEKIETIEIVVNTLKIIDPTEKTTIKKERWFQTRHYAELAGFFLLVAAAVSYNRNHPAMGALFDQIMKFVYKGVK